MTNSTTLITDMKSAISTGPSAASVALSNAASGQIMDLPGNMGLVLLKLQEAKVLLNAIVTNDMDSGDGIKSTLQGVLNSLS